MVADEFGRVGELPAVESRGEEPVGVATRTLARLRSPPLCSVPGCAKAAAGAASAASLPVTVRTVPPTAPAAASDPAMPRAPRRWMRWRLWSAMEVRAPVTGGRKVRPCVQETGARPFGNSFFA
ncbi:hypothetical protein GCM10010431_33770 [Streptomyces kunmingensis]